MRKTIYFLIGMLLAQLLVIAAYAQEQCSETEDLAKEEVTYTVDTSIPKHLKGATICVTLADHKSSCVPAEKFMVVPRKQKTVLGENKTLTKKVSCTKNVDVSKKNIVYADARKDHQDLGTTVNGNTATVESKKGLVPSINYYRREVLDSPIGAGIGIDTNGTIKGAVGIDF
jgi:hypothetical protein